MGIWRVRGQLHTQICIIYANHGPKHGQAYVQIHVNIGVIRGVIPSTSKQLKLPYESMQFEPLHDTLAALSSEQLGTPSHQWSQATVEGINLGNLGDRPWFIFQMSNFIIDIKLEKATSCNKPGTSLSDLSLGSFRRGIRIIWANCLHIWLMDTLVAVLQTALLVDIVSGISWQHFELCPPSMCCVNNVCVCTGMGTWNLWNLHP